MGDKKQPRLCDVCGREIRGNEWSVVTYQDVAEVREKRWTKLKHRNVVPRLRVCADCRARVEFSIEKLRGGEVDG